MTKYRQTVNWDLQSIPFLYFLCQTLKSDENIFINIYQTRNILGEADDLITDVFSQKEDIFLAINQLKSSSVIA